MKKQSNEQNQSVIDEQMITDFLAPLGFTAERFTSQQKKDFGQTPDFRVFKGTEIAFFCEVKSVFDDGFEGFRKDPTPNKISNKIHEAAKQFRSVNPNRELPNVLVFVNHEQGTDVQDLGSAFEGVFYADEGQRYPIYKKYSEGRIKDEKLEIDLFLWFQPDEDTYWRFVIESPFRQKLCHLFGIDPELSKNRL